MDARDITLAALALLLAVAPPAAATDFPGREPASAALAFAMAPLLPPVRLENRFGGYAAWVGERVGRRVA